MIKKLLSKIFQWLKDNRTQLILAVIEGIILAGITTLATTAIINHSVKNNEIETQLKNISNIYIGCNKAWADESFGNPQFLHEEDGMLLCAYVSEYFVIQMAFDQSGSTQAYLITALDDNTKIRIDDKTIYKNNPLVLGRFTFYDYPAAPSYVYGYFTNGTGRHLYSETYYSNFNGAYYTYHIASLDYGIGIDDNEYEALYQGNEIDDEVYCALNTGNLFVTNRSAAHPNSYGVSINGFDIEGTLFSYHWFNSQQLRNKYLE